MTNYTRKHDQHCSKCKRCMLQMLSALYGETTSRSLGLAARLTAYAENPYYDQLHRIHTALQEYRQHQDFVRARKLPPVDYYIHTRRQVVEFDEDQHFTKARLVSLSNYPRDLAVGYDLERWKSLCIDLDRHDNDPEYRDEQRAWYDTLRDFSSVLLGISPTVRIYAADMVWCHLDPENREHLDLLKSIIESKHGY